MPDILQLYTVKLILQPLVENAIYHGIKESEAPGLIAISGRRSGSVMELRVTDNGRGYRRNGWPCCRQTLRAAFPSAGEGYGIFNVNERIRLYFWRRVRIDAGERIWARHGGRRAIALYHTG